MENIIKKEVEINRFNKEEKSMTLEEIYRDLEKKSNEMIEKVEIAKKITKNIVITNKE